MSPLLPRCASRDTLAGHRSMGTRRFAVFAGKLLSPLNFEGFGLSFNYQVVSLHLHLNPVAQETKILHLNVRDYVCPQCFGIADHANSRRSGMADAVAELL